jgi:glycosyltransferase involved in cell wall biosynthesis
MKSNFPSISIITPSFNQGKFIEETILSILNQEYPNLEYLIMDGGSTDNTIEILKKYSGKVKWFSQPDNGQAHAINKGLSLSTGEIVSYLNSDDILMNNSLFTIAKLFTDHQGIDWLVGRCKIVNEKSQEIRNPITNYKNLLLKTKNKKMLLMTNYISQPATFWRRKILQEIGGFDERLRYVMDYDYWLRLWEHSKPFFTTQVLAGFRIQDESKTIKTSISKTWFDEENEVIQRYSRSKLTYAIHNLHRKLIESIYQVIN